MKPIYKVVDKELNLRLRSELENVNSYMKESLAKASLIVPETKNIAISKNSFNGKHTIVGLILEKGADTKLFKKWGDSGDGSPILVPKLNSKAGKELAKKLDFIGKQVMLFDNEKFEEELNYKPEKREVFGDGYLTINYLRFGWKEIGDNVVFVYTGYTGYKPSEKAQEMTISEYNEMFGR